MVESIWIERLRIPRFPLWHEDRAQLCFMI
jgi:hypothetical protein